jgi:CTP:molybdopterin cytidylyltransferase MocA
VPVRPVLIGAGRGARLAHNTDLVPKTLVPVLGRPMLDWVLEALAAGGFEPADVVFIAGYRAEVLRERYPDFTYVENADWQNNNVLLSLLCARPFLADGFVCSYTDIVYRPEPVARLVASPHDITLVCDTDWRRRYEGRTQHPETDAEKLLARRRRPAARGLRRGAEALRRQALPRGPHLRARVPHRPPAMDARTRRRHSPRRHPRRLHGDRHRTRSRARAPLVGRSVIARRGLR